MCSFDTTFLSFKQIPSPRLGYHPHQTSQPNPLIPLHPTPPLDTSTVMDIPPTQVDLVRALESIDHTDILAHHDTFHDHTIEHDDDDGNQGQLHQHLGIVELDHHGDVDDDMSQELAPPGTDLGDVPLESAELESWTREQLQAEIVKLRRLATKSLASHHSSGTDSNLVAAQNALENIDNAKGHSHPMIDPRLQTSLGRNQQQTTSELGVIPASASRRKGVKRKRTSAGAGSETQGKMERKRDVETGKRLEKERRTELGKVIRTKLRSAIGVGLDDPLPHPNTNPTTSFRSTLSEPQTQETSQALSLYVPDWTQMLDDTNLTWVTRFVQEIQMEAAAGQYPRVPQQDLLPDVIDTAARTAFTNMCKRYMTENDPKGVEKREKYTKKRRRWARKDLKQKRRSRAITDPAFTDLHLPPSALHIDYMSSEYSSAGEDEDESSDAGRSCTRNGGTDQDEQTTERAVRRRQKWEEVIRIKEEEEVSLDGNVNMGGKGGWAVGVSEKILEVRTPRWRSEQLNEIYRRLDAHANLQADTRANSSRLSINPSSSSHPTGILSSSSSITSTPVPRAGHVAPSHRRFTQEPGLMRKGKKPRDAGEAWMWASGTVGVWPSPLPLPLSLTEVGSDLGGHLPDQDVDNGRDGTMDGAQEELDSVVWEHRIGVEMGEAERLGLVNALEGL
ncbi:hypothetical protein IAR55_001370 [Kwoniella newhampshirensis]|uniref:Rrn9 domain-containing protein n=1 Tax=Kwoniella newhampshirensis TaxID=1651941 RepID=A0AAW0Z1Z2_9TREE